MNHNDHSAISASDIAAARLLLAKMGIDLADLLQDPAGPMEIPTFADYIPLVSQAVSDGTRRVYSTYWNRVVNAWGPRPITSVTPLEISQLAEDIKTNATPRRNARGGYGAAEHLIGALRCMYNHAVADCCPALKTPMKAAFGVPMWWCVKAPRPGWRRGFGGGGAGGCG